MDDYLSKPLQKADLFSLLEQADKARKSLPPIAVRRDAETHPLLSGANGLTSLGPDGGLSLAGHRLAPTFNRERLLVEVDGDEALLQRMITLFCENTPVLLDDIRASVQRGDSGELARSAHALLSSLGAFGANHARELTAQLEAQALAANYEQTDRTLAALENATVDIHAALAAFTSAGS
jgi:HPt (histidine-containing phosphotransfer) domain-containing protein